MRRFRNGHAENRDGFRNGASADPQNQISWSGSPRTRRSSELNKWSVEKVFIAGSKKLALRTSFTSKMYVFSDSVLCLVGKGQEHLDAANTWENDLVTEFVQSQEYQPYL